jgi:hypothetical protein
MGLKLSLLHHLAFIPKNNICSEGRTFLLTWKQIRTKEKTFPFSQNPPKIKLTQHPDIIQVFSP